MEGGARGKGGVGMRSKRKGRKKGKVKAKGNGQRWERTANSASDLQDEVSRF